MSVRAHSIKGRLLTACVALAAACAEPRTAPLDTTGVIDTTLAKYGVYHVDVYVPVAVTYPTAAPDGEFVTLRTSRNGNRVGRVNGRLSYWEIGKSAPEYMFRPDTNEGPITPSIVNNRGEVVLVPTAPGAGSLRPVYMWRGGEVKTIVPATSGCVTFRTLNNRGLMILETACAGTMTFSRYPSPFAPTDTAPSSRFTGEKCDYSTGYPASSGIYFNALNDSNELLVSRISTIFWEARGCRRASGTKFVGETGFVAGQATSGGFPLATLTDGYSTVGVYQLLDSVSRANWHITNITGVAGDNAMIASAIRLADNATVTVKLTRLP